MANYADYVRNYPDLLQAYKSSGTNKSIEDWGKGHYQRYGSSEGRSITPSATTYSPPSQQSYSKGISIGGYNIPAGTYSEAEYNVLSAGILTQLNGDIQREIEAIRGQSAANVANIQGGYGVKSSEIAAAASKYMADRDAEARKYIADQDLLKGTRVAEIEGKNRIDLQGIINTGLQEVENIRGTTERDVATLQGEYGIKQETERQKGQKEIAKLGSETSFRNALIGAFAF
jgi:hypothetical protein